MPKLYFCRSDNQSQGMLRAVLSWDECIRVMDLDSAIYVGTQFPSGSIGPNRASEVAILRVLPEESNEDWYAGYYRFDTSVMEMNEALQTLGEAPRTPPESREVALRPAAVRIASSSE